MINMNGKLYTSLEEYQAEKEQKRKNYLKILSGKKVQKPVAKKKQSKKATEVKLEEKQPEPVVVPVNEPVTIPTEPVIPEQIVVIDEEPKNETASSEELPVVSE